MEVPFTPCHCMFVERSRNKVSVGERDPMRSAPHSSAGYAKGGRGNRARRSEGTLGPNVSDLVAKMVAAPVSGFDP